MIELYLACWIAGMWTMLFMVVIIEKLEEKGIVPGGEKFAGKKKINKKEAGRTN